MGECRHGWSGPGRQGSRVVDGLDSSATNGSGCDIGFISVGSTTAPQGSVSAAAGVVARSARYRSRRDWRTRSICRCCGVKICARASAQQSLHRALGRATMGLTLLCAQCIPAPFSRASTTILFPLSTAPLPIGHPWARHTGYCIWCFPLLQIGQGFTHHGKLGVALNQRPQFRKHIHRAFVLERMKLSSANSDQILGIVVEYGVCEHPYLCVP